MRDPISPEPVGDDAAWLGLSIALYVPATALSVGWIAWRAGTSEVFTRALGDQPWLWLPVGLLIGAAVAGASQLVASSVPSFAEMSDALAAQLGPLSPPVTLLLAALSAVGEEWLFRGVLQPAWGWPLATLAFALVHVPTERAMRLWPVMAGAIGLLLAALFAKSGGLVAPIAVHFAINALNMRWLARRASKIRTSG